MILFKPDGNPFIEHPELNEYPQFTDLSPTEFKFVWHYANPTSKIKGKVKESYKESFGDTKDNMTAKYLAKDFPNKILLAIEVMQSFSPSTRMRAKTMVDKIFNDYEEVSKIDVNGYEDMDDKKKIISMKLDVVKGLPDIIKRMEGGFGITDEGSDKKDDKRSRSFMDEVHDIMNQD